MWQRLSDLAKTLITFGETLQQNRADIKELQQEVRRLSTALQLLAREAQHTREAEAKEREMLELQLENAFLKFEKRLRPATASPGQARLAVGRRPGGRTIRAAGRERLAAHQYCHALVQPGAVH